MEVTTGPSGRHRGTGVPAAAGAAARATGTQDQGSVGADGRCDAPTRPPRVLARDHSAVPPSTGRLGPAPANAGIAADLGAADRVVAVLAVPARYRSLLERFGSLDEIDAALRAHPDPTGWSALELVGHVADSLHVSAMTATSMLDADGARRSPVHVDAPRAASNGMPSRAVLGSLHAAAADLAPR